MNVTQRLSLMLVLNVLLCSFALASTHPHHSRIGSHGMVLFSNGERLFASHLPLYQSPHDFQIVYEISTPQQARLIAHLQQKPAQQSGNNRMLTMLPEVFDLNKLVKGEKLQVAATLYQGHFERGGTPWLEQITVLFEKPLFIRPLNAVSSQTSEQHQWQAVPLNTTQQLFIHHIAKSPSFDAIFLAENCSAQRSEAITLFTEVLQESVSVAFSHCQKQTPLYTEFSDFRD